MRTRLPALAVLALLSGVLAPLHDASGVELRGADRTTIDVYRPWRGCPKVFVEATLPDGEPGLFMVDTGADVSVLAPAVAERLGLDGSGRATRVAGIDAVADVRVTDLDQIALGGVVVPEVQVVVGLPGQSDTFDWMPVAGILGNNVWQRFAVELDYRADQMRLRPAGDRTIRGSTGHIAWDGAHPHTLAVLRPEDGVGDDHSLMLVLDTGAVDVIVLGEGPSDVALDYTESLEPVRGVASSETLPASALLRTTRRYGLRGLRVGGRELPTALDVRWLDWDRTTSRDLTVRGLIGHQVFEDRRLLLDYRDGTVAVRRSLRPRDFHSGYARVLDNDRRRHGWDAPSRALERARWHLGLDAPDRALSLLHDALQRHRDGEPGLDAEALRSARVLAARLHRGRGEVEEARTLLAPLSVAELVDEDEIVEVANGLVLDGRTERALALTAEAVQARPDEDRAWVARADVLALSGDPDGAHLALSEAVLRTDNPDAYLLRRAEVALRRGDRHGALSHLRTGVQLNPLDGSFLWYYAAAAGPDDLPTVRADLLDALDRTHPGHRPTDHLLAAHRLVGLDALGPPEALLAQGLDRDCAAATDEPARDNCTAWYLGLAGVRLDEALARVTAALEATGPRSDYLDTLAVVHEARGEQTEAAKAADRALRLSPSDPYLHWQRTRLRRAAGPPEAPMD